ncbi:DNA-3-methyladenine glycosylase [cf. Phormidesmis sp. LEGE 11477]|uniref:DNA-3-methyladenine glycosylase n=1 Tax=cf. Phormidesmis sp. LEGE 11477 TaxID=1828680 RepID=UPI00187F4097|nr:DNA-3-methyladenine glycosylase [cf. Phormidesmis sp. LEGE 11477]MBE9061297.1 DNA-3-methyladenine glycosylase [cf. Phormidesmis sp. LEGE 11477]
MTNSFEQGKNKPRFTPHSSLPTPLDPFLESPARLIEPNWCDRPSTQLAPDLLGCTLYRQLSSGMLIRATIVETEAYAPGDPACHAYKGLSRRNAAMFGPPGHSYVYLIYGMYHCLNVVSESTGIGSAVLIRALELNAIPSHLTPKQTAKPHRIAAGPGKLCRALAIDRTLDGILYHPDNGLWLVHRPRTIPKNQIVQTTRIGITKAADKPWRWYLKNSQSVSKLAA